MTALLPGGGYAEYALAAAPLCLPVPKALSLIEAAAIPETFFTVWTNLFDRGGCKAGDTVLIHGGTSGIGTTAIQLAAARGARVFATAGTPEKARACERLGAARGIDYKTEDFVEVVRRETDGKGVDVILDMVAASYFARNLESLALEGRLVVISLIGGARTELNLNTVMSKRIYHHGFDVAHTHASRRKRWSPRACGATCGRCSSRSASTRLSMPPSRSPKPARRIA